MLMRVVSTLLIITSSQAILEVSDFIPEGPPYVVIPRHLPSPHGLQLPQFPLASGVFRAVPLQPEAPSIRLVVVIPEVASGKALSGGYGKEIIDISEPGAGTGYESSRPKPRPPVTTGNRKKTPAPRPTESENEEADKKENTATDGKRVSDCTKEGSKLKPVSCVTTVKVDKPSTSVDEPRPTVVTTSTSPPQTASGSNPDGSQGNNGFSGNQPGGSQGNQPGGSQGNQPGGSQGNQPGGFQGNNGFSGNQPGGSQGNQPGGFQGNNGFNGNQPGGFQGNNGFNGNQPGGFQGNNGFNSNQPGGSRGNQPGGFQGNNGFPNAIGPQSSGGYGSPVFTPPFENELAFSTSQPVPTLFSNSGSQQLNARYPNASPEQLYRPVSPSNTFSRNSNTNNMDSRPQVQISSQASISNKLSLPAKQEDGRSNMQEEDEDIVQDEENDVADTSSSEEEDVSAEQMNLSTSTSKPTTTVTKRSRVTTLSTFKESSKSSSAATVRPFQVLSEDAEVIPTKSTAKKSSMNKNETTMRIAKISDGQATKRGRPEESRASQGGDSDSQAPSGTVTTNANTNNFLPAGRVITFNFPVQTLGLEPLHEIAW